MVAHFVVEQFQLVLPFKLRFNDLHANHRGHALPRVVTGEVVVVVLDKALFAGIFVDQAGDRCTQAGQVGAAIRGDNRIGKGKDRIGKAVGILNGGFHMGRFHIGIDIDWLVEHGAIMVEVAHKRFDAPLKVKINLARQFRALINQGNRYPTGEEGHLAETGGQDLPTIVSYLEDRVITQESLDRACKIRVGFADHLDFTDRDTTLKALAIEFAITLDFGFHPLT